MATDWIRSVFVQIPKKGNAKTINQLPTTMLVPCAKKVISNPSS